MQIVRAKKGDVREISICRREFIRSVNRDFSRENLNVLLLNSFEEGILEELESEDVFCLVSEKGIIGNVSLSDNQISGLYVKSDFLQGEYREKLLGFIEGYCIGRGIEEVYLYCTFSEKDFYLENGYGVYSIAYSIPADNPTEFIQMKKKLVL